MLFSNFVILVRGAGDLATGVIVRLHRAGFPVIATEVAQPLAVRRTVSFAQAVYDGTHTVEEVAATSVDSPDKALTLAMSGALPILADPDDGVIDIITPTVLIDARLLKRLGTTTIGQAPLVIGLGPGFEGGSNCHAAIETNRGHHLGRIYWRAATEADTGIPGAILGFRAERLVRAPSAGAFQATVDFGDHVEQGEQVGYIDKGGETDEIQAPLAGVVRGLLYSGLPVTKGFKLGDIDPRDDPATIYTISDKSLAIGGAVLTAILTWMNNQAN
ncbi:MAG: EF2563 family selenium-dependent molybdenum hydroxylase system protein [Chloroflexi bacterium]|nr:EF2563 family selenium-dependent molybdenum hydroxylase system protein [Chloroflexota bacterium]